eukprot:CFRG1431T1
MANQGTVKRETGERDKKRRKILSQLLLTPEMSYPSPLPTSSSDSVNVMASNNVHYRQGKANIELRRAVCQAEAREYVRLTNKLAMTETCIQSSESNAKKALQYTSSCLSTLEHFADEMTHTLNTNFIPDMKR